MAIGAGVLNRSNLPDDRIEILNNIHKHIKNIRKEASLHSLKINKKNDLDSIIKEDMPTNFISILGGRGSGKTSLIYTILKELEDEKTILYSNSNEKDIELKNYRYNYFDNIILPIIDPAEFNVEKNALGWIIYSFEEKICKLESEVPKNRYCTEEKSGFKKLRNVYEELKENYIKSRDFYREGIAGLSEGSYEYKKINENIIFADMKLRKQLIEFINSFINVLKDKGQENRETEPLIFITFDDIDISPEHGPEILRTALNYLKHPNIVVFILGNYDTFYEEIVVDNWNREDIPIMFGLNTIIKRVPLLEERKKRSHEFLEKVFPSYYRNYLSGLKFQDRLTFTPYGKTKENGEEIEQLKEVLGKFSIEIITGRNADGIIKENKSLNIKELLIRNKINIDGLENAYENLIKKERKFEGLEEYYEDFKLKQDIYKKFIENNEEEKNIELNDENLKAKNIYEEANIFANWIFKYPRGLINYYNELKKITTDEETFSLKIYELRKSNFYGRTAIINDRKNNFKIIYKLYDYINIHNLELQYNIDKFKINNIFNIDYTSQKVNINFTDIIIKSKESYKDGFNVSQQLLDMYYKDIKLNDTQTSFIQFFYDLCKEFLDEDYFIIVKDVDFSNVVSYKDINAKVKVNMINLKSFYHYYLFQSILEICRPIIIQDRKVHRNIRERLKAFYIYVLYNLKEYKYIGDIIQLTEWKNLSDWNKNSQIKNETIEHCLINFGNKMEYEIDYYEEGKEREFNILEYIEYFEELDDRLIYEFRRYIEKNEVLSIYSKYVIYLRDKSSFESRLKEIKNMLEYEDIMVINSIKLMKDLKLTIDDEKNNGIEKWKEVRVELANIEIELIKWILISICEEKEMDLTTRIYCLDRIYTLINERVNQDNINQIKVLLIVCGKLKSEVRQNTDTTLNKLKESLTPIELKNLENIKDEITSKYVYKLDDSFIENTKIAESNSLYGYSLEELIIKDPVLNIYSRLVKLIGDGRKNDTKIEEIKNIIISLPKENINKITFNNIINNYYESKDKKTFYSIEVNKQLMNVLEEYFVRVIILIWRKDLNMELRTDYFNSFINKLQQSLSNGNFKRYIYNENNKVLINSIKDNKVNEEFMQKWVYENEHILGDSCDE